MAEQPSYAFPRTVRALAAQRGVHMDCVAAGAKGSCSPCVHTLMFALLDVYGLDMGEVQEAVRRAAVDSAFEEIEAQRSPEP